MAGENSVTMVGGVTRDPELIFLNNGQAVVKFSIAVEKKWLNKQTQEWDKKVSYFDVVQYGKPAENVAGTIKKGYRVIVVGTLAQRTWETEDGSKRSTVEIQADEIGAALRFVTAQLHKTESVKVMQGALVDEDAF